MQLTKRDDLVGSRVHRLSSLKRVSQLIPVFGGHGDLMTKPLQRAEARPKDPVWVFAARMLSVPGIIAGVGAVLAGAQLSLFNGPQGFESVFILGIVAAGYGALVAPFCALTAVLLVARGSHRTRVEPQILRRTWALVLLGIVGIALAWLVIARPVAARLASVAGLA